MLREERSHMKEERSQSGIKEEREIMKEEREAMGAKI